MRLIHCADIHLDSKMTANLNPQKAKERKNEILNTFVSMVDYAVSNDVDGILIAGDMFDTGSVSALARNTVRDAIVMHPDIDFYYLKGNHDRDSFLATLEEIPDNLKLFSENWQSYSASEESKVIITAIELSPSNSGSCYNELVLDPSDINIVMLHGQESESYSKDKAEVINLRELKNKNIDYLALGHIHGYKEAQLDGRGKYCYPGCLEGRGFDELGTHGFVMLDIDEEAHKVDSTFVPFAFREMVELDVDISGIESTSDIVLRIDDSIYGESIEAKNLLKIVLTGEVDIECEKDIDYLVKHYEPLFYFVKIYDESKLKISYEDYKLDASLKGEFVRRVMDSKMSEGDKMAVIRIGLQAIAGEEIQ